MKGWPFTTTGGRSFAAGRVVGAIPFFETVAGLGHTLSGVTDAVTAGMQFENAPLGAVRAAAELPSLRHPDGVRAPACD